MVHRAAAIRKRFATRNSLRLETLEARYVLDSTVVFNEIMYNPGDHQDLEWIELHSEMAVDMDISGWRIAGVDYQFPPGTVIGGGDYLVVAKSPSNLAAEVGFVEALGPYNGQLSNRGERLRLINNHDRVMDELDFGTRSPWPVGADGSGASLAKINPDGGTIHVGNWSTSTQIGGTPGELNFTSGPLTGPPQPLVPVDSIWRYDDSGTDYGDDWLQPSFDPDDPDGNGNLADSWKSGPAPLGNDDDSLGFALATEIDLGTPTFYFRNEFTFDGDAAATELRLGSVIDDGAVFYLNGEEIARFNLPAGPIEHSTLASDVVRNANEASSIVIPSSALVVGINVLSVEVHQSADDFVPQAADPPAGRLEIDPAVGFDIEWTGTDGEFFDPSSPPTGARVPDNLALAANGAVPFTSSDLGPQLNLPYHRVVNVNDGFYGNAHSWIGGASPSPAFAGVRFGGTIPVQRIAFGRDNGNGQFDDSAPGTDCCGGQLDDRWQGTYTLQFTTVPDPDRNTPANDWTTIGTLNYISSQDIQPGAGFTGYLRHEYNLSQDGGAIDATGIRIVVPATGLGGGTAIDEIEIYADEFTPPLEIASEPGFSIVLASEGAHTTPASPAAVPDNLVLTTVGLSTFGSGETNPGDIGEVADGLYGDDNSWTSGGSEPAFVGVDFGDQLTFDRLAFGRDNGDATDSDCPGGVCTDDSLGVYTVQITDVVNPETSTLDTGNRSTGWETVGTLTYNEATDGFQPHLRHEYVLSEGNDPLTARGLRIVVSDPEITIDEIELSLSPQPEPVVITPAVGFDVQWDGNDGDFFDQPVPQNLALSTTGTTAFGSGQLGGIHLISAVNDGLYGNSNSWIGSGTSPNYIGLDFGGEIDIDRIALGRDNGNNVEACGGQCTDRSLGNYTLQFTTVATPSPATPVTGIAATGWQDVADIRYDFREDGAVGGGFTEYLRHEYSVRDNGALLTATGIRLIAPSGAAIDELEVYGPENPDVVFSATLIATEILPDPAAIVFNEVSAAGDGTFFVELANQNAQDVDLAGYVLSSSNPARPSYTFPARILTGDGLVSVNAAELGFSPAENEKLFLFGPAKGTLADAVLIQDTAQARSPEYDGRWLTPDGATPGAPNVFAFESDVVINEILYHAPGKATSETPAVFTSSVLLPIDTATQWRYRDSADGLSPDWATQTHSVGQDAWKIGPGLIGFETSSLDEPIRTQVPNPPATFPFVITYYFEREFTIDHDLSSDNTEITLAHFVDDGAVFYVNGVEFHRVNMPGGPIGADTFASSSVSEAGRSDGIVIPKGLLVQGVNRISVEVHQGSASSSDVVFGAEISVREIITPFVPGTPFTEDDEEFIELFNRGSSAIDLTGWSLHDAVRYDFEPGTMIEPGEYLVVARNAATMQARYANLTSIAGQYDGTLSNSTETIRLRDAFRNPVDEVTYFDSGRWAGSADGGGTSLELRDPFSDNRLPEAWAASDESAESDWHTVVYSQVLQPDGFTNGITNRYREFITGLLSAGEVFIDDISVVEDPDGANIQRIQNGDFESDAVGSEADKWRINGNHSGTVVLDPDNGSNHVLHVVATGNLEDRYNHAETTFVDNAPLVNGTTYEISFRAKWLSGSNQLNTHLYFDRMSRTTLLPRTETPGTPGEVNSVAEANVGPTYENLTHTPIVPNNGQAVTVVIKADDPHDVDQMLLWYSVAGGAFQNVGMNSTGGGVYQGVIPGQSSSKVVQFYVEGTDDLGASSYFPAAGPDSRALYKVQDGAAHDGQRHNFRIIMTPSDTANLHSNTNSMSNGRTGSTVIYNESEVFYDVGTRLKGSNAGRNNSAFLSFNVAFDPTHLFRGVHDSVAIDRSGRSGPTPQAQDEILIKHIGTAAGGAAYMYDDIVQVIAPNPSHNRPALLMMSRYGDEFLQTQFDNGGDGTVFKLDIAYVPNGTIDGNPESLKNQGPYGHPQPTRDLIDYGDGKEAYRSHLLIRNNRAADDYSQIIAASQALSLNGDALRTAASEVIDIDQWARVFALQSLTGAADVYTQGGLHHNIDFYVRPSDGRVLALPWDWDFAFTASPTAGLVGSAGSGGKLMTTPGVRRLVHGHMLDIINTSFNNDYLDSWIDHYGDVASQNLQPIKGYVNTRRNHVLNNLPNEIPFEITTNGGNDIQAVARTISLQGQGWIDVHEIRLAGNDNALDVKWTDDDSWQVVLPIVDGDNVFEFVAIGYQGEVVGTDTITVTNFVPNPIVESLRITEINYNPASPTSAEDATIVGLDGDDFEFVELQNAGTDSINLFGVRFTDGIDFVFDDVNLASGERIVVVRDQAAFELRYGDGIQIAGEYDGGLSNGGERIAIETATGVTIFTVTYDDNDPWPEGADGVGRTLQLIDPVNTPPAQYDKFYSWRGSTSAGGSPGTESSLPVGIVVNEVLTHTDPPLTQSDSIELLNTTAVAIDISGWWLSDAANNLAKFEIPAGTVLGPGELVVFDESDFNPTPLSPAASHFALNGTEGDDVWLVIPNGTGGVGQFVDEVHFGATFNGQALARFPNPGGRLAPMNRRTLGCTTDAFPAVGPLVVTEINFNPGEPSTLALLADPNVVEDDLEFLEIHNPTGDLIDLTQWRLRGGVDFNFPAGATIAPNETIVVLSFNPEDASNAGRLSALGAHYSLAAGVRFMGGWDGQLADSSEEVRLERPDIPPLDDPTFTPYVRVDAILFDDQAPWPGQATDGGGSSIQRRSMIYYGSDPTNWVSAAPTPGSHQFALPTPGDLTGDGLVTSDDIDVLNLAIHSGNAAFAFDLSGDGVVDVGDREFLVEHILNTSMGDTNLDGRVDAQDLNAVGIHWRSSGDCLTWSVGDLDGDANVDAGDLNRIGLHWQSGVVAVARRPRAPLAAVIRESTVDEAFHRFGSDESELSENEASYQTKANDKLRHRHRQVMRRDVDRRRPSRQTRAAADVVFAELSDDALRWRSVAQ